MVDDDGDPFEYETMVEQALRGVVRQSLQMVDKYGLTDDHHFFITFQTNFPGVEIPDYLQEKYPEEMTIVLQYQFEELTITDELFSIVLSFNNVPERMTIPFDAITGFADPSVKFGLQFHVSIEDLEALEEAELEELDQQTRSSGSPDDRPDKKADEKAKDKTGEQDNVVSIDQFRKT